MNKHLKKSKPVKGIETRFVNEGLYLNVGTHCFTKTISVDEWRNNDHTALILWIDSDTYDYQNDSIYNV